MPETVRLAFWVTAPAEIVKFVQLLATSTVTVTAEDIVALSPACGNPPPPQVAGFDQLPVIVAVKLAQYPVAVKEKNISINENLFIAL